MSIPKYIHYCWFGGIKNQSKVIRKCLASWKTLTDYQICEWNEQTFDSEGEASFELNLAERRYSLASDFARFKALYEMGGIYLDTDVEIRKPFLSDLLEHKAIFTFMFDCTLSAGFIGCEPKNPVIADLLSLSKEMQYTGALSNDVITRYFLESFSTFRINNKFQVLGDNIAIFPKEYFDCPTYSREVGFAVHHSEGSWRRKNGFASGFVRPVAKSVLGEVLYSKLAHYCALRRSSFYPLYQEHISQSVDLVGTQR